MSEIERRVYAVDVEVRQDGDEPAKITGYAAVFNSYSEDLGLFREIIRPGAFAQTIRTADVRALWNHDPNYVLGRNRAGTLTLKEDDRGLKVSITPPNTQWANDLLESMRRGDVNQMSFGFRALQDNWFKENGADVRELLQVELFDVSPVTYPAYPATTVGVRSIQEIYETKPQQAEPGGSAGGLSAQDRVVIERIKLEAQR